MTRSDAWVDDAARTSAHGAQHELRVAVLGGGESGEREVSLASARAVFAALSAQRSHPRCSVAVGELRLVQLEPRGVWRLGEQVTDAIGALGALADIEVFFLCLHGGAGEDGTLQGLLASAGRRHTGSGVQASALCMDKLALRGLAREQGLRVAAGACIDARSWSADPAAALARCAALSGSGLVVKPRRGGSSVDTALIDAPAAAGAAIERVLAGGDDALVEERIGGVELSCGVLQSRGGDAHALPPIEIQPDAGRFFDYEQKYSAAGARELCPPVSVDTRSIERVRALALRIHRAAGCRGYSRSDFIVPRAADGFGEPVLLEVNTLPGLTERSLLPQEAAAVGIGYGELCLRILENAVDPQT